MIQQLTTSVMISNDFIEEELPTNPFPVKLNTPQGHHRLVGNSHIIGSIEGGCLLLGGWDY